METHSIVAYIPSKKHTASRDTNFAENSTKVIAMDWRSGITPM